MQAGAITWVDDDQAIAMAAENLRLGREQLERDEARLLKLLCDKYQCHPGQRVIRTDKASRREFIVTKAFISNIDLTVEDLVKRPKIWAKRADRHNSGNPHHEMQLWTYWEAATD